MRSPWFLILPCMLLPTFTLVAACDNEDHFECGVKVGADVAQCDGDGQVCVCGSKQRRCARYDPDCISEGSADGNGSGYRYVFGDKACIPSSAFREVKVADPAAPENSLCPEVKARPRLPKPCGFIDPISGVVRNCAADSDTCVCTSAGGVCATENRSCPSGYAHAGDCLPLSSTDFVQTLATGELCADAAELDACGAAGEDGRVTQCTEGRACGCAATVSDIKGQCLRPVSKRICASGLLFESAEFKQCAPDETVVIDHGLCPGRPDPAPVQCGIKTGDKLAQCKETERCVCSLAFTSGGVGPKIAGACATASAKECPTGYWFVHNQRCVELSSERATVVLDPSELVCPLDPPQEQNCGIDAAGCGANASCVCDGANALCVVEALSCESQRAFVGSSRCVPTSVELRSEQTAYCSSTRTDGGAE
jgi:hypothetical protein